MTDDNQNETMPTPLPLPGQVFIRPGIDDRPDYEKTLTPEAKAALKRLAVQQRPRVPEASNERPEVQAARLAEGGSPLTAAAHLDAAVPNLESSFLDLRDPMTAPDGSRPNALQVNRLTAGFALGSLLFAAPIAALDVVLIPQRIDQLVGDGRVAGLALTMALGMMLSFFMNAWIAVGSDHTFGPLGRRTPWIISGALLSAASLAILSVCDLLQLVIVFWLLMQIGYAMIAMPLAAAFGERVPDKFRDRADSWHGMGLALGQLLGILVAVYRTTHPAESGWDGTTRSGIMLFAIWFIVAGIVTLLVLPREGSSTYMPRESVRKGSFFSQYRPPKHAPKFAVAFIARMLAVAATTLIAVYQWYLAAFDLDADGLSGRGVDGRRRFRRFADGRATARSDRPCLRRRPCSRRHLLHAVRDWRRSSVHDGRQTVRRRPVRTDRRFRLCDVRRYQPKPQSSDSAGCTLRRPFPGGLQRGQYARLAAWHHRRCACDYRTCGVPAAVRRRHRLHAAGRRADDAAEVIARVHIVNLWWRGRVDALMFTA